MEGIPTQIGAWTRQVERFLRQRLADPELCRDLAQEAAARLIQAARSGHRLRNPRSWMFRAAHNLAVDEVRRRLPGPLGVDVVQSLPDPRTWSDPGEPCWELAGHLMRRSELLELLPEAMDHLPDHYRRVLDRRYGQEESCAQVADREAISEDNVKVRLHRARRRLRELLVHAARHNPEPLRRAEAEDRA
ncbi:MAG: sigma-70 family RNA polymerase sigma factor [Planctomycetota bacterium]|nr:MAG: sigma-70 family RNA polymerase sigma factor [Planctomycetota bacterium]